jgi:hypothetical protein
MCARSNRLSWPAMIIALSTGVAARAQVPPTSAPTSAPASAPAATSQATTAPAALDPHLDEILDRLEQRDVTDLHARLTWRQDYVVDLPEDATIKRGEIWYQKAQPVARFVIRFSERLSAGGRVDKWDEMHAFDGCWYTEVQSRTKTYVRREVRKPDDPGNPYKVGQGIFPLPFGQKKSDILKEFEARLAPPAATDPPGTDHVLLTPHSGTQSGQNYKELDFWIDRSGPTAGLPTKVRVAKIDGTGKLNSHITITFNDAELNKGFGASVFELKVPAGYQMSEERLEPNATPASQGP